jgi:hypothetical protein
MSSNQHLFNDELGWYISMTIIFNLQARLFSDNRHGPNGTCLLNTCAQLTIHFASAWLIGR